jgi:DNA repair protein RAD5
MNAPELEHRPAKKRRFFVDDAENDLPQDTSSLPFGASSSRPSSSTSTNVQLKSSETEVGDLQSQDANTTPAEFDATTFSAFVGEDVPPDTLQKISDAAGNDLERAINMYLDGSWIIASNSAEPPPGPFLGASRPATSKSKNEGFNPEMRRTSSVNQVQGVGSPSIKALKVMPKERYMGAFGVGAWSTKSGTGLIAHGEKVRIERSRIAPKTKLGRGGKVVQVTSRNQRSDVVTRFTNARGEEVGRLPEEAAKWVSTLLDQKLCRLDGTCVYAPDRLRVNDTVYLQLKCYFLRTAFEGGAFLRPNDDNRVTGIFDEKESREEKDLRLRQVALVKLFDEINLHPVTTNEMMSRHKKDGIITAAEMAEQYDKEKPRKPRDDGGSSPSSEEEDGQELEEDQLNTLYQKAQTFDFNMPEAETAESFALSLRKYQKQALHWMVSKERDTTSSRQHSMHPLWEEYQWPIKDVDDGDLPLVEGQDKVYVNPYSGEISLEFPVQEQNCLGGILADEMGLGKTIEMLSLMHSHQSEVATAVSGTATTSVNSLPRLPQNPSTVEPAPCTTLVVAPLSLLAQWESEAMKASKAGSMKTVVYYGNDKTANLQNLCCTANAAAAPSLIITSYGIVLSEFNQVADMAGNRGSHGGLFSVEFFRVILDEAHTIKNRQSKTAKACYEIQAKHRWVLTGTPIVNRLEDLFSLVRFLRVEPWSNFSFWKTFITVPFEQKEIARAINVVQTVLEPLVLRRTKDMKTPEGEALVPLPPRTITIEEIELSEAEREVYDFVFMRAKRAFNASVEAGTLLKSYTTIFAQILRLRQSCCHPVLTRNQAIVADEEDAATAAAAENANGLSDDMDLQELINRFTATTTSNEKEGDAATQHSSVNFTTHALRQIQTESAGECPICAEEPMIDPAVTACWHSACKKCLEDYIKHQIDRREKPRCVACREIIHQRDVFEVVRYGSATSSTVSPAPSSSSDDLYGSTPPARDSSASNSRISLRRLHPLSPSASTSAKIAALVKHLLALPHTTKSVVFSQFTSFLDLIAPQLSRNNMAHLRFDGSMAQKQRAQVLRAFNAEDAGAPKVLLLSLRAGGVGLNLTAASRVFMMDPWWSFAVEAQAIDRVHRMGQTNEVKVVRFVVKESIEGRMLRVQERKMAVAGSLGVGQSQGEGGEEEKKKRRIEELEMLLG